MLNVVITGGNVVDIAVQKDELFFWFCLLCVYAYTLLCNISSPTLSFFFPPFLARSPCWWGHGYWNETRTLQYNGGGLEFAIAVVRSLSECSYLECDCLLIRYLCVQKHLPHFQSVHLRLLETPPAMSRLVCDLRVRTWFCWWGGVSIEKLLSDQIPKVYLCKKTACGGKITKLESKT